jgi:hypothetical protein
MRSRSTIDRDQRRPTHPARPSSTAPVTEFRSVELANFAVYPTRDHFASQVRLLIGYLVADFRVIDLGDSVR